LFLRSLDEATVRGRIKPLIGVGLSLRGGRIDFDCIRLKKNGYNALFDAPTSSLRTGEEQRPTKNSDSHPTCTCKYGRNCWFGSSCWGKTNQRRGADVDEKFSTFPKFSEQSATAVNASSSGGGNSAEDGKSTEDSDARDESEQRTAIVGGVSEYDEVEPDFGDGS
jgi:hypothetical protein